LSQQTAAERGYRDDTRTVGKEEVSAVLALVLCGAVEVLVSKGEGPPSPERLVFGIL
jgi:hypothetical protein